MQCIVSYLIKQTNSCNNLDSEELLINICPMKTILWCCSIWYRRDLMFHLFTGVILSFVLSANQSSIIIHHDSLLAQLLLFICIIYLGVFNVYYYSTFISDFWKSYCPWHFILLEYQINNTWATVLLLKLWMCITEAVLSIISVGVTALYSA